MIRLLQKLTSRRIRELEAEVSALRADLAAFNTGQFEKHSLTQMTFTPESGLQATFEGSFAKILAAWAFNALKACDAKNYVEFQVFHPEDGFITVTVQKTRGETPAAKAARLEQELAASKAA